MCVLCSNRPGSPWGINYHHEKSNIVMWWIISIYTRKHPFPCLKRKQKHLVYSYFLNQNHSLAVWVCSICLFVCLFFPHWKKLIHFQGSGNVILTGAEYCVHTMFSHRFSWLTFLLVTVSERKQTLGQSPCAFT